MKDHQKIKKILSAYFDQELTAQEKALVEEHIKECSVCAQALADYRKLSTALKSWPDEETSPDSRMKMYNKVAREKKETDMAMKYRQNFKVSAGFLTSLVTILIVALVGQVYFKRGVCGRLKSSADDIGEQYSSQGRQYEPYYLSQGYQVPGESVGARSRSSGGYQDSGYEIFSPEKRLAELMGEYNTEEYAKISENDYLKAADNPVSTFSIDVDTAAYTNVRRYLDDNKLPPIDAVRIEEMVNYFTYDYPQPTGEDPFTITTGISKAPWNPAHQLLLVGLQGRKVAMEQVPPSNLVFLIDVSGSMQDPNKLPLLKQAFKLLTANLREQDRVSIVVYAGAAGTVLESTPGDQKFQITEAIDRLEAGGSTAGGAGIELAYSTAKKNFIRGGNNRVILATDGDFNVGVSSTGDLLRMIEEKRADNIFLSVIGFGMGNYKDGRLEQLADKGNGNAAYVDNLLEAKKVFVTGLTGTIFTIAKDVKIQVEFNPARVKAYRLIGYENRLMKKEDFNDDRKDAGELGAGHTVTALYEVVLADSAEQFSGTDPLKYQKTETVPSDEFATVKLRYKKPDDDQSRLLTQVVNSQDGQIDVSENVRFASAVTEFGLLLRDSQYKGQASYEHVLEAARAAKGSDHDGYRAEFIRLVEVAQILSRDPANKVRRMQTEEKKMSFGLEPGI